MEVSAEAGDGEEALATLRAGHQSWPHSSEQRPEYFKVGSLLILTLPV